MFLGEFRHSLDLEGRIIILAKFRESLGAEFVMTKGLDSCLFLFPMAEWKILEEKLRALPFTNKDARAFVRFFTAGASEATLDKQGRALIPQHLREHSFLDKDAVVIGVPNRIEIWSSDLWEKYTNDENLSYASIAEHMEDLGF